jgi:class 3 adenylate cyclase
MATPDNQRKLSAIMFTDIVSYTSMMERDEAGTMAFLNFHNTLLHMEIDQNGGTVIKTVGDAFLADFSSAVNAVRCAVSIQKRFMEHNKEKSDNHQLRVGIHVGDVVISNNDIFGDGVNVASRLQSICEPGGICISEDVFNHVRNLKEYKFHFIGSKTLKNVSRKVKAYTIDLGGMEKAKSAPPKKKMGFAPLVLLACLAVLVGVLFLNPVPDYKKWLPELLDQFNLPPMEQLLPMVFPTPTMVPTPVPIPTPIRSVVFTPTPMPIPTSTRTATPTATATATPTATPMPVVKKRVSKKKAMVKPKPTRVVVIPSPTPTSAEEFVDTQTPIIPPTGSEVIKSNELPMHVPSAAISAEPPPGQTPLPGVDSEQPPQPTATDLPLPSL